MTHFAGYVPRFHPSDFEMRTRDGVGADWPISYWDLKAVVRAGRARAAGRGPGLAVGRPARLPARRRTRSRARPRSPGRARATAGSRCASGRSRSRTASSATGRTASTAASASQGCKVNAKATPADHAPPRRDRARRRGPRRLRWSTRIETRRRGGRCTGVTYVARRPRALPARRRRRRLRLRDRDAAAAPQLGVRAPPARARQRRRPRRPLRDGAGRDADRRRASPSCCACTRRRRPRSPRSSSTRPTSRAGSRAASRSRRSRRCRSAGPSTCSPTATGARSLREYMRDYNHWTVLGVLVRAPAAAREPRDARRRARRERDAGRPLQLHPLRQRQGAHRVREADPRRDLGRRGRAGHAHDRPLRAPRRRLPHGLLARRLASSTRTTASGGSPTCSSSTAACCRRRARRTRRSRSWRSPTGSAGCWRTSASEAKISNPRDLLVQLLGELLHRAPARRRGAARADRLGLGRRARRRAPARTSTRRGSTSSGWSRRSGALELAPSAHLVRSVRGASRSTTSSRRRSSTRASPTSSTRRRRCRPSSGRSRRTRRSWRSTQTSGSWRMRSPTSFARATGSAA